MTLDRDQQPALSRIDRAGGGGGGGWRRPAAVLLVALVAIVVAGRLDVQEAPPVDLPLPTARPEAADATPRPVAADPSPRSAVGPWPQLPPLPVRLDVFRYFDGIPTSVRARPVHRVDEAVLRAGERILLLGGWYVPPHCPLTDRCLARLADSPASAGHDDRSIGLTGITDAEAGPRVLRGRIGLECPRDSGACLTVLHVWAVLWRGDFFTRATPIEPQPLLTALATAFPEMAAAPFRDLARCPVPWPLQTYRSTTGGPWMTLVFPTASDRAAAEESIVANWPTPGAATTGGQCTDHLIDAPEPSGWLSRDNVMLWLSEGDEARRQAEVALADARAQSSPADETLVGAITPWMALRALQRWEPDLDILPPHDTWIEVWSGARDSSYQAYALNDPFVRVLFVFPGRAERRLFQADVEPAEVGLIGCCGLKPVLSQRMLETPPGELRWIGIRNMLLLVGGPEEFDAGMRQLLEETFS